MCFFRMKHIYQVTGGKFYVAKGARSGARFDKNYREVNRA